MRLLKIMDRDVIEIETGRGTPVLFDTSNLTIIFMGAFADLYKEKEEKLTVTEFQSPIWRFVGRRRWWRS